MKMISTLLILVSILFSQEIDCTEVVLNLEKYLKYRVGITEKIPFVINGEDAGSNNTMITYAQLINSSSEEYFQKSKRLHVVTGTTMGISGLVMFLGPPAMALRQEDIAAPVYVGSTLFCLSFIPLIKAVRLKRRGYEQYDIHLRKSCGIIYHGDTSEK